MANFPYQKEPLGVMGDLAHKFMLIKAQIFSYPAEQVV